MMAAALLVVLMFAKALVAWGRPVSLSVWTPLALAWQDVALVLIFLAVQRTVPWRWVTRIVYATIVAWVALSVPVDRVLGSPISVSMLGAARGTLADSITHHATVANVAALVAVLAAGWIVPVIARRLRSGAAFDMRGRRAVAAVLAGILVVMVGPFASARAETAGSDRNAIVALARSVFPRVPARAGDQDWRRSPYPSHAPHVSAEARNDLSHLAGSAAGMNVLMVVLESTAARYLSFHGAAEDPTPNLAALAGRGLAFENAYATYPQSIKSIIAYLSARFPAVDVPVERHAAVASPSLASVLGERGYATALFHSGRFMYLGMDTVVAAAGFDLAHDAGDIGGNRNSSFGIDELAAVRALLRWIDDAPRDRPFFAAYLPIAGHHPYAHQGDGPWPRVRDIDRYRNALHEGDVAFGELLAGLRERGLDRSTLIVAFGDHGQAFGQRPGNYGHSFAIYEENVRVPLLFAIPAGDALRGRTGRVASLVDVAPTVLALLGMDSPAEFQGRSLLDAGERMALFFTDYSNAFLGLRDGCSKYIYELESKRSRLFDVCADPDETVDLAPDSLWRAIAYRERLLAWSAAQVARIRNP